MTKLAIDQLLNVLGNEVKDQNQLTVHLNDLLGSIAKQKQCNKKTYSRHIQNLLFILHNHSNSIELQSTLRLFDFIYNGVAKYKIFMLEFVKCALNLMRAKGQLDSLLLRTCNILRIYFNCNSNEPKSFILNHISDKFEQLNEEERSIVCTYYLIFLKTTDSSQDWIPVLQNRDGPILLLYEEKFRNEFASLLSAHNQLSHLNGDTKIMLKNGIHLIQANSSQLEIASYFIDFIVASNTEHELFADYLDYFLYYTSKSKLFERAIDKLKIVIKKKIDCICCIALTSLILEFISLYDKHEIDLMGGVEFQLPNIPSCGKIAKKIKKFIGAIDQSLQYIAKKRKMQNISNSIVKVLMQLFHCDLATPNLKLICCLHWIQKDELLKNEKIPREIKELSLLRYSNELDADIFVGPCQLIYRYKSDGNFSEEKIMTFIDGFTEHSLPAWKVILLIGLLKGKFKICLAIFDKLQAVPGNAELSFLYFLLLFEMGFEEKKGSNPQGASNSLAKFIYQFVLDYFGLPAHTNYAGNDRFWQFFSTLNNSFQELIEHENLALAIQFAKNSLKLIDFLLDQEQNGTGSLEHILTLSYFYLSTLYLLGNLYLMRGSMKESKWCYCEGQQRATKLHASYFVELFAVRMEVLAYHYSKSISLTSCSHLKSCFDNLMLKCYVGTFGADFHLSQQVSQYYKEKYNLFTNLQNNAHSSTTLTRLYGDDKVLALIKSDTNPVDSFACALSLGSIKHVELALANVVNSDSSCTAACLELAKGNTMRRELQSAAQINIETVKKWIFEFKKIFLVSFPPNRTVISMHQLANNVLTFNVWTSALPTALQFKKKLEPNFTVSEMTSRWKEVMEKNKQSLQLPTDLHDQSQLKNWWIKRKEVDEEIEHFLHDLEKHWVGSLKGIFFMPLEDAKTTPDSNGQKHCSPFAGRAELENSSFSLPEAHSPKANSPNKNHALQILNKTVSQLLNTSQELTFPFCQLIFGILRCSDALSSEDLLECLERFGIDKKWQCELQQEIDFASLSLGENDDTGSIVLIPFREIFDIPIENLPSFRKKLKISRLDSFYTLQRMMQNGSERAPAEGHSIGGILNPSNDLANTQSTFESLFCNRFHRSSIVGRIPSEQEFLEILHSVGTFLYFGHGGGEAYLRPSSLRKAKLTCRAFLIGCSSGKPSNPLDSFADPSANPIEYLWAGCPLVVGTLWDVTDKDIDRVMTAALDNYFADSEELASSLWESRSECLLKNATGCSLVFYGLL